MRKIFPAVFLVSVVLLAGNAYSQGLQNEIKVYRPDFSGTWKFNLRKSGFTGEITGEASNSLLVIEQKLPAILVSFRMRTKYREATFVNITLYSDGRGDEVEDFGSFNSFTEWKGNILVMTTFSSGDRKNIYEVIEFKLSADGNTLTGTKKNASLRPGLDGEQVRVFNDSGSPSVFDRIDPAPPAKPDKKLDRKED